MKMTLIILGLAFLGFLAYPFLLGFVEGWRREEKPKLRVIWYEPAEKSKK